MCGTYLLAHGLDLAQDLVALNQLVGTRVRRGERLVRELVRRAAKPVLVGLLCLQLLPSIGRGSGEVSKQNTAPTPTPTPVRTCCRALSFVRMAMYASSTAWWLAPTHTHTYIHTATATQAVNTTAGYSPSPRVYVRQLLFLLEPLLQVGRVPATQRCDTRRRPTTRLLPQVAVLHHSSRPGREPRAAAPTALHRAAGAGQHVVQCVGRPVAD